MSQVVTDVTGRGGNTKPPASLRRACFTLNNWTDEEVSHISSYFEGSLYVIGKEVGECGTPHLQGYVEFPKMIRWTTLTKLNPRIHWEKCRGNRDQNVAYCTKDGNFVSTFPKKRKDVLLEKYANVEWRDWQQQILDIIESEPDSRTVNWFWEPTGDFGKSFFSKYLYLKYDPLVVSGKTGDVANQLLKWLEAHEETQAFPKLAIMDVPRCSADYINYQIIEKLKDGLLYSGKYEGGICAIDDLHLFVFANVEPDYEKLSMDRWNVVRIE